MKALARSDKKVFCFRGHLNIKFMKFEKKKGFNMETTCISGSKLKGVVGEHSGHCTKNIEVLPMDHQEEIIDQDAAANLIPVYLFGKQIGTWSSAEYARPVSKCGTAVKAVCVRSCRVLHQSEARRLLVRLISERSLKSPGRPGRGFTPLSKEVST
ncbi:hypothetical protein MTR67_050947 [Solanum verrucosum]|uniref:Uncharacterized protein n=1 Tax=Solanum verrucosum TaxID=315347 RepID=A0AAF0V3D4_SOLVR|nr:hypothetical protein MTR67_050947 [Solanum verrucosum]